MMKEESKLLNETNTGLVLLAGILAMAAWQDVLRALLAATGTALAIIVYQTDWAMTTWEETRPYRMQFMAKLRALLARPAEDTKASISIYDAFWGFNEATGTAVIQNLARMGHIFIVGMTQYGKTTFIYNVLYHLLNNRNHEPDELQIAFADAKRNSFQIFSRIPHLFAPIATNKNETTMLLRLIKAELDQRTSKFEIYAGRRICTNLAEYAQLSGEQMPWLLVFVDETADLIEPGSQAEKDLESLLKMGLAYGIQLVLSTQRPTAKGVSHEAQSQTDAIFCTYMRNSTEYGAVARIPRAIYSLMTPTPGRFMAYIPKMAAMFLQDFPDCEGWGFVRSQLLANRDIERLAREWSGGRPRKVWEDYDEPVTADTKKKWVGDETAKLGMIREIHEALGRTPTAVELRERIPMSRKTSETWMQKYREIYG